MASSLKEEMAKLQAPRVAAVGFGYKTKLRSALAPSASEASSLPMSPQDCHLTCIATLASLPLAPEVKSHIRGYRWEELQIDRVEPEAFKDGRQVFLSEIVRGLLEL